MKWTALGLPAVLAAAPLAAQEEAPFPSWLAGAWEMHDGERWTEEFWTSARGGLMIGASREGRDDALRSWEHIRIERGDDERLRFVAMPQGGTPVAFPAVGSGEYWIEFANPAHDYPQRIRYWREGTRLRARISTMDGGRPVEWTFTPMGD